ncbi:alpha/beta hydrolase [uncultured Winogradskyella sp.]|uniref:alpha/beta hydrolase n=1 Tax=uncultured Winogradskyella sp. TaxID=395353 RepID=UPI00262417DE|nr:alpha/beta hydrolase [uncultured Winogradskyella sp.]
MRLLAYITLILFFNKGICQEKSFSEQDVSVTNWIDGTLLTPNNVQTPPLAIIIAGSGPTDRNGNQNFLKNNALKKLSERLAHKGIATFRYDKRIVKQIRQGRVDKTIMFDDFVKDAKDVLRYFKEKNAYSKVYLIGHSQGSLVGMLAAKDSADGFISLAGAGQNIGDVIVDQVTTMAPQLGEEAKKVVVQLKQGNTITDYPSTLASVFNTDLQPFMINWMQYNPTEIIKHLNIPILLINGTKDLQVSQVEAKLLKDANENAELKIIENMNHILFEIKGDDLENSKSYNETFRPLSSELITSIVEFIKT